MISSRPKFLTVIFAYLLTLLPNACLVEQAIAAVVNSFSYAHQQNDHHHDNESVDHHTASPSHNHDNEGHEDEFCCDNEQNFYIGSAAAKNVELFAYPASDVILFEVDIEEQESFLRYHSYLLHQPIQPKTSRARDKYALSCLLHAPPLSV